MQTVSIAQTKAHLSEILHFVEGGGTVVITKRGKAIANLAAIKKPLKPLNLKKLARFRRTFSTLKTSSVNIIRKLRDEKY